MPLKLKRTCDDGGGVDTEQKALSSFGLGVFLHFFSSSRDDGFYHVTRETTRTCVIFFLFFFETTDLSSSFWGEKTHTTTTTTTTTTHKTKQSIGIRKSSLFITQATLTMSIAQLGSTTAVSIHFVELDLRVARWMQGSRGCEERGGASAIAVREGKSA